MAEDLEINLEDVASAFGNEELILIERHKLETETSKTLLAFLDCTHEDEEKVFTFRTLPDQGHRYVQRMRSELSRWRKRFKKEKLALASFKMYVKSVEKFAEYDEVQLSRKYTEVNKFENEISRQLVNYLTLKGDK